MLSLERQNEWRERYRQHHPGWRPATEVFAGRIRDHLRPGDRLLDIGCGRGGVIEQLPHPLNRTYGIDPDPLSLVEHRLPALPRAVAYSDHLPFQQGSFDVVVAAWVLEHLTDPWATFAAVSDVLRVGGTFVFITPNARHPLAWANKSVGRFGQAQGRLVNTIYGRSESDTFPTIYKANTPRDIARLAAIAKLDVASLELIADPSYLAFNAITFQFTSQLDSVLPPDRRIHMVGVLRKKA